MLFICCLIWHSEVVQLLGNCLQNEGQLSSEVVQLLGNCGSKRACVFLQIRFNVSRKLFNCWATFGFNRGPKLRMSRQKLFNCWATVGNMRVNFLPKLFNCWVTVGQKERAFFCKSGSTFPGSCLTVGQLLVSIGVRSCACQGKRCPTVV